MKPMSGLSRMFINIESERLPMDFIGIFLLDPSTAPDGHDYHRVRAQLPRGYPGLRSSPGAPSPRRWPRAMSGG